MQKKNYGLLLLLGMLILWPLVTQAQSVFTAEDALKVVSLRSTSFSPDGAYLSGLRSASTRNRFGVDHFRFGDPSYIRPASYELIIYDVERGTSAVINNGNINNLAWSPDGEKLAYIKVEGDAYRLYLSNVKEEKTSKVDLQTNLPIASNTLLEWMPDGENLLVALRKDDWMKKGMAMYKEATSEQMTIYDSEEPFLKWDAIRNHDDLALLAKVSLMDGTVTTLLPEGYYSNVRVDKQGAFLVYQEEYPLKTSYNRKDGAEYEWKKLNLTDPADTLVIKEKSKERQRYIFSDDNRWMAWADSGHVKVRSLLAEEIINLTEGKNQLSESDTTKVKFSVESWSPDATRLIARSKQGLWLINREDGTVERFLEVNDKEDNPPRYQVRDWSSDGAQVYLEYNATDQWERGLFRFDVEKKDMVELLKSEELYRSWEMAENGSRWMYRYSDGDRPDNIFVADADLQNRRQLTDLNPWVKDKKFTKSELIKYLDADGQELYGILYYPVDYDPDKKYPLVCEIYERFFDNGYRSSMNIIANQGYFGFRPSVNLEEGRPGVAWIKGVTAGINKLIERGLVDEDKIGVHGTSYGGYAASLLIAQTDRFAAAINISGKTNIISFLGDSPRIGTRNYAAAEVGQDRIGASLWDAPMKYIEHSAVMYADRMNTPHLLLTGEGDWNVPAANTRELYYALRRLGKKAVWVNYKTAGHGAGWAGTEDTYLDQWKRMLDWYEEHFKEKEESTQP